MKRILISFCAIILILGAAYALIFFRVIQVDKAASRSPALAHILTALHLYHQPPKAAEVAAKPWKPSTQEQSKLEPQRKDLEQREAEVARREQDLAARRIALRKMENLPPGAALAAKPDPTARLVSIYEKMSPEDAAQILAHMNDSEVISLLIRMKERQVSGILTQMPPDRAARLSRMLLRG